MSDTVFSAVRERARSRGDEPFYRCGSDWRTLPDLVARAEAVGGALDSLGVSKGDRVAILAPNRSEMIDVILGCLAIGAIEVPLNAFLKGEFLRYQLADCEATVFIGDESGLRAAAPLLDETAIKHLVSLDDVSADTVPGAELHSLDTLISRGHPCPEVEVTEADVAAIIYTSGTTGLPKGCMLSHRYFLTGPSALVERGWILEGDRLFTAWPLFHTSGQVVAFMTALLANGSVRVETDFSVATFLDNAREDQANVLLGVGMMGAALLATPPSESDTDHAARLAVWIPMPPDQQVQFEERFGVPVITEAFGQTECFPISMAPISDDRDRLGLGIPTSHVEVALFDSADRPVGPGEIGEIVVRPKFANAMYSGYWRKPQETVEAWRNLWHHTGDLARMDEDGRMRFVDRKKDAVRRRGENVSSLELEAAIAQHPAVAAVAVCAVPSPLGEDDIKATIVLAPDAELTAESAFEFFRESLPYFAIPRYVEIRDSLPVNALARVMKHQLRDEGVTDSTWDLEEMGLQVAKAERRA